VTPVLVSADRVRVLFDGTTTEPQLDHPEGIAVHPDGSIWCGGERGQIFRLPPDGSRIEQVASTDGFCLGMAFDADANLFVCDLKHAAVFRIDGATSAVERFADGVPGHPIAIPNYPAFDGQGRLFVSDSHGFRVPGPGVFRFERDGSGELWWGEDVDFANGLAVAPDGRWLYVVEMFAHGVFRIPILEDGSAGPREQVATLGTALPDGLAFGADGDLYVGCYEPSQVLRVTPDGRVETVYHDVEAHMLAHPTNLAFAGTTLLTTNLGRWHLTAIDLGVEGVPLPPGR
jgi:sugar lactone lactonase YvrE